MSNWLWHLWHDPVRDNPWSFVGLVLCVLGIVGLMWVLSGWRR